MPFPLPTFRIQRCREERAVRGWNGQSREQEEQQLWRQVPMLHSQMPAQLGQARILISVVGFFL